VLAARAAGMAAVAVTWGAGERDALLAAGPDVLVDTVPDLATYLLGRRDG
jgi:pyrophosphatase PpaX